MPLSVFPFTADHKCETAIRKVENGELLVATEGAAEVIVEMSVHDAAVCGSWHDEIAWLSEGTHKVIAVIYREIETLRGRARNPSEVATGDARFPGAGRRLVCEATPHTVPGTVL